MLLTNGYLDRLVKVDDAPRDEDPDTTGVDDLICFTGRGRETRANGAAGYAQLNSDLAAIGSRKIQRSFDQIDGLGRQGDQETLASRP